MDIHVMKPENQILIVDEKEFYRIKKKAEMTDSDIEAMAEKRFLKYVRDSGINISFQLNTVEGILKGYEGLITELNYDERGYPTSINDKVKYTLVDDIVKYVRGKVSGYEKDIIITAKKEFSSYKAKYDNKMKWYKRFLIATLTFNLLWIFKLIWL